MTETEQQKRKMQARMFDMGHVPKERVVNRVFNRVEDPEAMPSDEKLQELLADEKTHDDIQDLYG
jgi:hypothetical protein